MNVMKRTRWAQAICLVVLLGLNLVAPSVLNSQPVGNESIGQTDELKMNEEHGTRAVQTVDWPMFHNDVYMTGAQDPSVTVPGNNLAYTFDSGGDIEATPAVVGDWVFFGNNFGPGDDYSFYGLNETDGWVWSYNSINNWMWRSSPAVADIPGIGLMVFVGQSSGANNRFYGFDADPDDNNDGLIDGSDLDEGQPDLPGAQYDIIWEATLSGGFYRHSPLVAEITALGGNVIYTGTTAGVVHCINAATGASIWNWTEPLGEGFQYGHPTLGYDVNGNPQVFIINDGSTTSAFYALDAVGFGGSTTMLWSADFYGNDVRGGPAVDVGGPGADDDRVFFATWDNPATLYCLDATPDDDGNGIPGNQFGSGDLDEGLPDPMGMPWDLLWSYVLGGSSMFIASTPALHNSRVYIGIGHSGATNNALHAIEQNGTENKTHIVWTYDAPGDIYWNSPAIAENKVIVTTRGYWGSAGLAVLDEATGAEIWYNTTAFSDDLETSCSVAKGNIYVGGDDNLLHVFGGGAGINDPPEAPVLYSPEDAQFVITPNAMLDWSDALDPEGDDVTYVIEINDTNDFGVPAYSFSGGGSSHLEVVLPDGMWYWRVRAVDLHGALSDWSVIWSFTVDTTNDPPVISVVSPNGGEIWNGVHLIHWTVSDPEAENMTYSVWLSDNSGSSYDYLLASGLGTHSRHLDFDATLWPEGTTYSIKVEAKDARGLVAFDTSDADFSIDHSHPLIGDWPQYKHYANKTSYSPVDAPDTNGVAWISAPGFPYSTRCSPAIFNGHVFYGDHQNSWYSLNDTDGSVEWRYRLDNTNNWADGSMAVAWIPFFNTYGVFGATDDDNQYSFLLFDIDGLSDGDQGVPEASIPHYVPDTFNADVLWGFYSDGQTFISHPTVEDEIVYIWLTNDTSGQENIYAFDVNGLFNTDDTTMGLADTDLIGMADRIWEYEISTQATAPTVADGKLFITLAFSGNPNVFAFDADPSDLVDEGLVDPAGAPYDLLWTNNVDGSIFGASAYHNDTIWLATYGATNIYSLNASTGVIKWSATDPSGSGDFQAAPAYWDDRIYIVAYNDNLYCYDATPDDNGNGIGGTLPGSGDIDEGAVDSPGVVYDLIWSHTMPGTPRGTPAVADNKVFVPTYATVSWGQLIVVDAIGNGDGTTNEIWNYYHNGGEFYAGPAVANGYVYQSTEDGEIFKFGVPINPDLAVFHEDIMFDPPTPGNNNTVVDITVRVSNLAPVLANTPLLRLIIDENDNGQYDIGETIIYNASISSIPGYNEVYVTVPWLASPVDYYNFIAEIDPLNTITEPFDDNNLAWSFYAVDLFDTVDYIIVNDTAGQGGNWVGNRDYNIGETDTFYAHGFNLSSGFLGLVEVTWNSNDTGVGSVNAGPGQSTTFSADSPGFCMVTATYVLNPSITNSTGTLHVLDWTVDYITIVDTQGTGSAEIPDQTVSIGFTISGIAAAFNNTGGYIGDIIVAWDVLNSGSSAFTNPPSGQSSTFDASSTPGTATWRADDQAGNIDTVVFTVTDYTVDYILIVDTQAAGASEIPDQAVDVGITIDGWAAAFNDTAGYIGDISVSWSVTNSGGATASTSPPSGDSSTFDSGTSGGSATWTADDGSSHTDSVAFTINAPTVDSIIIVDSPASGAVEIPNQTVDVRFTIQGWAAGFNTSIGYMGDVAVTWSVQNSGSTAYTTPLFGSEQSTFNASDSGGVATWTAELSLGISDTVEFTINPPTVDYITIVDTPGIGISEIQDQTVPINTMINGWAAGFNNTIGYVQDVSVTWTVQNSGSSASTNPSSGVNSTFDSGTTAGVATWKAEGPGLLDTVKFTVIDATIDYIEIVDSPGTGATEIQNQVVGVGFTITGWAAAFNGTSGYIGDVSVTWTVVNFGSAASTDPPSGVSSTFDAGNIGGTANWTADDNSGHTDSVIFTINPPTRDYIMIVDSPGTGVTEIPDLTVSVGFSIQGWAAGYNNTIGYLGDVTVTWSVLNDGNTNATTSPIIPGMTSTFNSGWNTGNATWIADDGTNIDTVVFTISPPTVDFVRIVDSPDTGSQVIPDQTIGVGVSISGWAAGFNNTAGYVEDVFVTWSIVNVGTNASANPLSGNSSDFYSGWSGGDVTWKADDGFGHSDTVEFVVDPPEVDHILIVDSQGTGISEIPDQTIDIGFSQQGWAASFNLTIGYLGDVPVTWTVDNVNTNATTSNPSGLNSTFYSGWQEGIANWTAEDASGNTDSVSFTISPPGLDYIIIVDAPDTGSAEVPDQTVDVGISISGWAAGFNNIAGYIGDVDVTWSVVNIGGAATKTDPSSGITSKFNAGNSQGTATWRADDGSGHADTVGITVNPPFVEYIQIRDAPDGGGNVVDDPVYPVGHTTTFYGALMNATAGFIDNAPSGSLWSSSENSIVTVSSPGESTDLACSIQNRGFVTITVDDGSGHINSTTVTVLEPTTDKLRIMDAPGGVGSEVSSPDYPVGYEGTYYGAMFNDTAGYLGDVPSDSSWSSGNPRVVVTPTGSSTDFTCSDTNSGTATITLDDNDGHFTSVTIEILEPTVDSVKILDSLNTGANEITDHDMNPGDSRTYFAVGFNDTAGNLGSVEVDWSLSDFSIGSLSSTLGIQTTFSAFLENVGTTTVYVKYEGDDVTNFLVTVVDNIPPVADAGSDQSAEVAETVHFDGTDSTDNVEIDSYIWTFEYDGQTVILNGKTPSFEFLKSGTYEITLEVVDSSGNSDTDTFTVEVKGGQAEPDDNPMVPLILFIIIVIALLLLLFFLMGKKKKKKDCRICGKEFYPQSEAEAKQGMCAECAKQGVFGQAQGISTQETPKPSGAEVPPPGSSRTGTMVRTRCPDCQTEFEVTPAAGGPTMVKCPNCGVQGMMEL